MCDQQRLRLTVMPHELADNRAQDEDTHSRLCGNAADQAGRSLRCAHI